MIYMLAPTLFFCSFSMILMSIFHQQIFETPAASLFVAAVFHLSITNMIFNIAGFLLKLELKGESVDTSDDSGEGGGSSRRRGISATVTTPTSKSNLAQNPNDLSTIDSVSMPSLTSTSRPHAVAPSVILQEAVNSLVAIDPQTGPLSIELLAL